MRGGRRGALGALGAGGVGAALAPAGPAGARGLAAYVKRRPPGNPAEFLPPVLEARQELAEGVGVALKRAGALGAEGGGSGAEEGPGSPLPVRQATQDTRNLLRVGALGSIRDNMKSVSDASSGAGEAEVAQFFSELETFDADLMGVIRGRQPLDAEAAGAELAAAVGCIDSYLAALPAGVVAEARSVVGALEPPAAPTPDDVAPEVGGAGPASGIST